jgi:hypothetical protein
MGKTEKNGKRGKLKMPNLIGAEKLQFDELGNPYYLKTISKDGKTEKILPQDATPKMLKELTVNIILRRNFYSPIGEPKVWFGVQQIQITVPDERSYRYHYLVYDKKSMGNICMKIVNPFYRDSFGNYNSYAWDFTLNLKQLERESYEFSWIKRIGKPQTITQGKAIVMLRDREAIVLLNDSGEEQTT